MKNYGILIGWSNVETSKLKEYFAIADIHKFNLLSQIPEDIEVGNCSFYIWNLADEESFGDVYARIQYLLKFHPKKIVEIKHGLNIEDERINLVDFLDILSEVQIEQANKEKSPQRTKKSKLDKFGINYIINLKKNGLTLEAIADKLGCSTSLLYHYIKVNESK